MKTRYGILTETTCTALWSTGMTLLTEGFHSVVNCASRTYRFFMDDEIRTYHFLIAAREYQRAVQNNPNTMGYATQIRRMSITVGSATPIRTRTEHYFLPAHLELAAS